MANAHDFEYVLQHAAVLARIDHRKADYWVGYQRGIRRAFHGESFGTAEDHAKWLSDADSDDPALAQRGRGYRDGLAIMRTAPGAHGPQVTNYII